MQSQATIKIARKHQKSVGSATIHVFMLPAKGPDNHTIEYMAYQWYESITEKCSWASCIMNGRTSHRRAYDDWQHSTPTSRYHQNSSWTCWLLLNSWMDFWSYLFFIYLRVKFVLLSAFYSRIEPCLKNMLRGHFWPINAYKNYFT